MGDGTGGVTRILWMEFLDVRFIHSLYSHISWGTKVLSTFATYTSTARSCLRCLWQSHIGGLLAGLPGTLSHAFGPNGTRRCDPD
jgi:hypothetical protein